MTSVLDSISSQLLLTFIAISPDIIILKLHRRQWPNTKFIVFCVSHHQLPFISAEVCVGMHACGSQKITLALVP